MAMKCVYKMPRITLFLCLFTIVNCIVVQDTFVFEASQSPHIITDEIVIEPKGNLIIQPGTTLKFETGLGITVRGTLTAKVSI